MAPIVFLLLCPFAVLGFIAINDLAGATSKQLPPKYLNLEENEFRMTRSTSPQSRDAFIHRILNPFEVHQLNTWLQNPDTRFEFTKTEAPIDLLKFFRDGEAPNVNSPTSSGTWDPSKHGNVLRSRIGNGNPNRNMGPYRSLYGSRHFPAITLSYDLIGGRVTDVTDAILRRDARTADLILDNTLGDGPIYYYPSKSEASLDWLGAHYPKIGSNPKDPKGVAGLRDARSWREVVLRGEAVANHQNTWKITENLIAYVTIFSFDPEFPNSVKVYKDGQFVDGLRTPAGVISAQKGDPTRLTVRYYSLQGLTDKLRLSLRKYCDRYLYLFPNIPNFVGKQVAYESAQEQFRRQNPLNLKQGVQRELQLAKLRIEILEFHQNLASVSDGYSAKITKQFKGERYRTSQDSSFRCLWRNIWEPQKKCIGASLSVSLEQRVTNAFLLLRKDLKIDLSKHVSKEDVAAFTLIEKTFASLFPDYAPLDPSTCVESKKFAGDCRQLKKRRKKEPETVSRPGEWKFYIYDDEAKKCSEITSKPTCTQPLPIFNGLVSQTQTQCFNFQPVPSWVTVTTPQACTIFCNHFPPCQISKFDDTACWCGLSCEHFQSQDPGQFTETSVLDLMCRDEKPEPGHDEKPEPFYGNYPELPTPFTSSSSFDKYLLQAVLTATGEEKCEEMKIDDDEESSKMVKKDFLEASSFQANLTHRLRERKTRAQMLLTPH